MSIPKLAYRISEAVEATGIGRTKLYQAIKDGHLEVCHIGRRTIIPAEALTDFVEKLRANERHRAAAGS